MKNNSEKGITLIALVITIIVLLILASIGTYSGIEAIKIADLNRFIADMQVMQTEVNGLYDKYKNNGQVGEYTGSQILTIGKDLSQSDKATQVFTAQASEITDSTGYRYFDKETINSLNPDISVGSEYFVNIEKRSVISCTGIENNGTTYYTLEQLPSNLYNVEYTEQTGTPTFEVKCDLIGENKYKVTIKPTYSGNIEKWTVKYKLTNSSNWNTSNELTFNIATCGSYDIKIQNENIESAIQTQYLGYVPDGLILHYDGIFNTRTGNNKTVSIWQDLSGNKNDAEVVGASWQDNNLYFDGTDDYVKTKSDVNYKDSGAITLEFVDIDGSLYNNSNNGILIESSDNYNNNITGFAVTTNEFASHELSTIFNYTQYNQKYTDSNTINSSNVNVYDIVINTSNSYDNYFKIYKNGEELTLNNQNSLDITDVKLQNYVMYIGARAGTSLFTKMNLGNFKIYNKELTQDEIRINYQTNNSRFNS